MTFSQRGQVPPPVSETPWVLFSLEQQRSVIAVQKAHIVSFPEEYTVPQRHEAFIRQVACAKVFLLLPFTMKHPNVLRACRTMAETSLSPLLRLKVNRTFADVFAGSFTAPRNTVCTL